MHTPQGQLAEAWGKEVCAYVPCCRAGDACGFQHPSPISRGTHCKEGNAACRPNRASQVLVRSMLLLLGCSLAVIFNVSADPPQSPRRCGRNCAIVQDVCAITVVQYGDFTPPVPNFATKATYRRVRAQVSRSTGRCVSWRGTSAVTCPTWCVLTKQSKVRCCIDSEEQRLFVSHLKCHRRWSNGILHEETVHTQHVLRKAKFKIRLGTPERLFTLMGEILQYNIM